MSAGFLIAAPKSGSGKTTLALGLMRALRRSGLRVAAVKSGPDYIDPAFHAAATGRPSFNLDTWAMEPDVVQSLAALGARDADFLIAEGSMGLFDGVPADLGRSGASADTAAALGLPVLLVLDVTGQAQSAAALVLGYMRYDPRISIGGVVLNRVGSQRHIRLAKTAIEALGIPVVGALPKSDSVGLPERHLGLVQAGETSDLEMRLEALADFVTAHVDLAAVQKMATALAISPLTNAGLKPPGQRIALAQDAAFSFIYPHLLQGWRAHGAEIVPFSPLANEGPDDSCDFCWLPGGYPELHAGALSAAEDFRTGLRNFAQTRGVHGECGGYMALGESLIDAQGHAHKMAGLLSVETSFAKRKMNLGYRAATLAADCGLGLKGAQFKGHEFHYAVVTSQGADAAFATTQDAYGSAPAPAGSRRGHVTGSFFHLIAAA